MQVPYLGRAPRTKETLPDFLKWRRVTRHPLVFRRLTGSQRTPGFWGVTFYLLGSCLFIGFLRWALIPMHSFVDFQVVWPMLLFRSRPQIPCRDIS